MLMTTLITKAGEYFNRQTRMGFSKPENGKTTIKAIGIFRQKIPWIAGLLK